MHGLSDYYGNIVDVMIKEINDKAYGGGHTCLKDCSLSEIQTICKHEVIDGIYAKEVHEVKYPIITHAKLNINSTCNASGTFDVHNEGGSFGSKEEMRQHVLHVLKFLKLCLSINPEVKCTAFDSPICSLAISLVT